MGESFGAADLSNLLGVFLHELEAHERQINRLNVFPVADDDTGSNMVGTMRGVLDAVDDPGLTMTELGTAIRRSALMSARGNSGIILSQWLRGFVATLAGVEAADVPILASAIRSAADAAYASVQSPLEGTILTVAAGAAAAATDSDADTIDGLWRDCAAGADDALATTPRYLEALRKAGVVDAGGFGLRLLFDAAAGAATPTMQGRPAASDPDRPIARRGCYEVTFLLESPDPSPMIERWRCIGDSIEVAGGDAGDPYSCHIHTGEIGMAIESAIDVGRPFRIRVDYLEGASPPRGAP